MISIIDNEDPDRENDWMRTIDSDHTRFKEVEGAERLLNETFVTILCQLINKTEYTDYLQDRFSINLGTGL